MQNDEKKEIQKIKNNSKLLEDLIKQEGYKLAKNIFLNKVSELINVSNLDLNKKPEEIAVDIKARKLASEILIDFINLDIEGTVDQTNQNLDAFTLNENNYIIRVDN